MPTQKNSSETALKSRYIIHSNGDVVENGVVVVKGGKIDSVVSGESLKLDTGAKVVDFGNSAILPGFINGHTHLELSDLHGLTVPDKVITSWISQLIRAKMKWKEEEFAVSTKNGIRQSIESGVSTVADITNSWHAFKVLKDSPLRKVVFGEVINLDPGNAKAALDEAMEKVVNVECDNLLKAGLSPHAPYTVSSELYKEFAKVGTVPLTTHIAETKEEVEYLKKGKGAFVDFLNKMKLLSKDWQPPRATPIEYLKEIGILKNKPLLVHCNYLTESDISIISESGSNVVFCPRSHNFFEHKNHPFQKLLNSGVNVALGTDSLASNDSLSILDEMKFLRANIAGITPELIISMATINGAKALGLDNLTGELAAGRYADIAVVRLSEEDGDVYANLFSEGSEPVFTMINGDICFDKYGLAIEK